MRPKVELTSQALRDLENITGYIARDNPAAATKFAKRLLETARTLQHAPRMGTPVKDFPQVRVIHHRPYLIFYRYNASQPHITILHFWHGAQNPDNLNLT